MTEECGGRCVRGAAGGRGPQPRQVRAPRPLAPPGSDGADLSA
jgi:hypothetical protein